MEGQPFQDKSLIVRLAQILEEVNGVNVVSVSNGVEHKANFRYYGVRDGKVGLGTLEYFPNTRTLVAVSSVPLTYLPQRIIDHIMNKFPEASYDHDEGPGDIDYHRWAVTEKQLLN